MVLACAVVASLSWGLGFYGLSVYLAVLNRLHGWSPALISAATTGYYLASGLLGGCRRDRRLWGPRAVLVYGALAMGASLAALGRIRAPWELFAVYLLLATAWASLSGTVITATVVP